MPGVSYELAHAFFGLAPFAHRARHACRCIVVGRRQRADFVTAADEAPLCKVAAGEGIERLGQVADRSQSLIGEVPADEPRDYDRDRRDRHDHPPIRNEQQERQRQGRRKRDEAAVDDSDRTKAVRRKRSAAGSHKRKVCAAVAARRAAARSQRETSHCAGVTSCRRRDNCPCYRKTVTAQARAAEGTDELRCGRLERYAAGMVLIGKHAGLLRARAVMMSLLKLARSTTSAMLEARSRPHVIPDSTP